VVCADIGYKVTRLNHISHHFQSFGQFHKQPPFVPKSKLLLTKQKLPMLQQ
jgi:hypothetical protein